jgi:DUF1680 family protein
VTGAHGSRHRDEAYGDPYELPPDRAYGETCAAIASFHWNWRLLLATGRARYADEMERALYNAVAVAVAADGTHFFYSNPLQSRTGRADSGEEAAARRQSWYKCACCPPNIARLMASLHGYVATAGEDGVQIHLYGGATVGARVADTAVRVEMRTGYPWSGRIELDIVDETAPDGSPWTLALRVPAWCEAYTVWIDGEAVPASAHDGYVRLTRVWASGTSVVLDLEMPARRVVAHPRVDAVRGCVALARGPLVYCLEQSDLPPGVLLEDVRLAPSAEVRATSVEVLAAYREELPDVAVVLTAGASLTEPGDAPLYSAAGAAGPAGEPLSLTAVPYFAWGNRRPGPMRVWIPTTTIDF